MKLAVLRPVRQRVFDFLVINTSTSSRALHTAALQENEMRPENRQSVSKKLPGTKFFFKKKGLGNIHIWNLSELRTSWLSDVRVSNKSRSLTLLHQTLSCAFKCTDRGVKIPGRFTPYTVPLCACVCVYVCAYIKGIKNHYNSFSFILKIMS